MNNVLFYSLLADWYSHHRRELPWRETSDPYAIWLSEIILQQTRVEQGIGYYYRFLRTFPTVELLASAHEDEVLRLWQGLGYYTRARNLHKAAQQIVAEGNGFPDTYERLRTMPGVGAYTAGAIASFAYNLPYPALDGNVYRVLSRLTNCSIAFDSTEGKKHFHHVAEQLLDRAHPGVFNAAIMEFGALYCTPHHPDCMHCAIAGFCHAYEQGTVENLPVRKPRPKLKNRYFLYSIYIDYSGNTMIHQRQEKDIWHHLYEFPLIEFSDEKTWIDAAHQLVSKGRLLGPLVHQLSHQRLHARAIIYRVQKLPSIADTKIIPFRHIDDYALSRLNLKILELLPNWQKD